MSDYIWIIFYVYVSLSFCFHFLEKRNRRFLAAFPFSKLRKYNTLTNRFLLMMLDKYKYIAPKKKDGGYAPAKKERNYFYYTKKIYKYMMLAAIPWLVVVYIVDWYLIKAFVKWHLILSVLIGCLPVIILDVMCVMCDIKVRLYSRKM